MRRFLALCLCLCGCEAASPEPGTNAILRIEKAQFHPGAMPTLDDGPEVLGVQLLSTVIFPGLTRRTLQGSVASTSTAVALGLGGDVGYWTIPPGSVDTFTRQLTWGTVMSFSPRLPLGEHLLIVRAVDPGERFGPPDTRALRASEQPIEGLLVVALSWTDNADLDLHVVDASRIEIWARNPNSYQNPRPGAPPDPAQVALGGIFDVDSNAQCVIDGRRRENVSWQSAPPAGHYLVRVDTSSMCAAAIAYWTIEVFLDGASIAKSRGAATANDADRFAHGTGGGVLALEFDVP